jgi:hypothetical protein
VPARGICITSGDTITVNDGGALATTSCQSDLTWQTTFDLSAYSAGQLNLTVVESGTSNGTADHALTIDPSTTDPSVVINDGAASTSSSTVALRIYTQPFHEVYVTNTAGCASGGSWEYNPGYRLWTLAQNSGTARVYVKARNVLNGNVSSCVSQSITRSSSTLALDTLSLHFSVDGLEDPAAVGWTLADSSSLKLSFSGSAIDAFSGESGVTYECRSAPAGELSTKVFANCDGAQGTSAVHSPTQDSSTPEGSYETELRLKRNGVELFSGTVKYYVLNDLNGVAACPELASNEEYFEKASTLLSALFADHKFNSLTVEGPKNTIEIAEAAFDWLSPRTTKTAVVYSLRRRLALSADKKYILLTRNWKSRSNSNCKVWNSGSACDALVMSPDHDWVCLNGSGTSMTAAAVGAELQTLFYPKTLNSASASSCSDPGNPDYGESYCKDVIYLPN